MGSLGAESPPHVVEDCFGLLKLYSDGSIFRSPDIDLKIPIQDDGSAEWKDRLFDENHGLHLRLYRPRNLPPGIKLPIVLYIHGGGFCFGSRSYPNFHNSCLSLTSGLQALLVAPDHRLAPEHRLPAAIDDVHGALRWLQAQAISDNGDEWLRERTDLARVFVLGDSSGGNLAHHLAVRLGAGSAELSPARIRGYILLAPFFGGTVMTASEKQRPSEAFWNMDMYDRFWRLSLPEEASKDHPWANPFGPGSSNLEEAFLDPILVIVGGGEILRDRVEDYARRLNELGKGVKYVEFEGKEHGFFTDQSFSQEAKGVIQTIKDFISTNSMRDTHTTL
ncbi:Carboxylesterase [Bertholletia excelsa]